LAAPLHPYTRMLLACHPDRGAALTGHPRNGVLTLASAARLRFHPRCPSAVSECANALRCAPNMPITGTFSACFNGTEVAVSTAPGIVGCRDIVTLYGGGRKFSARPAVCAPSMASTSAHARQALGLVGESVRQDDARQEPSSA